MEAKKFINEGNCNSTSFEGMREWTISTNRYGEGIIISEEFDDNENPIFTVMYLRPDEQSLLPDVFMGANSTLEGVFQFVDKAINHIENEGFEVTNLRDFIV